MTGQPINSLNGVLAVLDLASLEVDKEVTNLTLDSRSIVGGELFVAVPGFSSDGRDFIADACKRGAIAVLAEAADDYVLPFECMERPVIPVPELQEKIGLLADRYYRHPSEQVKVVGVTGTNGKTSCCWFLSQLMGKLGIQCALMGTIGKGLPGQMASSVNTTADVLSTHRYIAELAKNGISALAMEVSSHGLDQGRVDGVTFDVALFTHISRDHLDYHNTLEEYAQAKAKLFSRCQHHHAVIGIDDAFSQLMLNSCPEGGRVLTWSLENTSADVYASNVQLESQGISARIHTPWGEHELKAAMLGRFNLENMLAVIAVLGVQGYPLGKIIEAVADLETVPGRMQRFGGGDKPLVLVDYAHTPDAISSVLSSLREHGARKLGCIYGCGGDRDRGKRPEMTRAAVAGADYVVLTSDNPRTESPDAIIADALEGISVEEQARIDVVVDRGEAIACAVSAANAGDILVVAGKGHEDYQEVNGVRHHFDDREQVQRALANWRAV